MCGSDFAIDGKTTSLSLVCKQLLNSKLGPDLNFDLSATQKPFVLGVFTDTTTALTAPMTGFNMDYTQLPC